jgi:carboxyl-terminal processing protease
MKRRLVYGALVAVLGLNLFVGAQIYFTSVHGAEKDDAYPNLKLFTTVLDKVRSDYVDGEKLTYQELIYAALRGMLSTLDPHSEFMEPIKYDDLKKDTQGEFGGVGIVISMKDNALTVVAPMEDTPGFRAGILSGDRIVKIDGKSAEKLSLQDAVKKLRGEPGTKVTVTIFRPGTGLTKDFELTRAQIKVDTVKDIDGHGLKELSAFPLSENNVGYVRLIQFGEQTSSDLEEALNKLDGKGMTALILDLRGNPGGLLDQAVKVCEKFLPRGQLVVSTEGRDARQKSAYPAMGGKKFNLPIVVLVNSGSASASEIVAGCLQDATTLGKCKAIIVGEQTFGKGSVQSILPLQDGSALRLTTAKYYTPSHKVIHEKGITPDIMVPMTEDEERDVFYKRTPGGIESLPERDQERVRNARDPQLERAMDLLKGISLYTKRFTTKAPGERASAKAEKVAEAK